MISRIGVIGAGQMGSGIAQICARAGYTVALSDVSTDALARAVEGISANLARQVSRGRISEVDRATALAAIGTGTDYALFGDCDVVIEAATEKEAIKREILKQLVPL